MLLAIPSAASACSCVPPDAEQILAESDAAFIGKLKSVQLSPEQSGDPDEVGEAAVYRYRVHRDFGANLPRFVHIVSPRDSAACGLPRGRKHRQAMGINRAGDRWTSNLCSMVDPKDLREAAAGSGRSRADGGVRGCA